MLLTRLKTQYEHPMNQQIPLKKNSIHFLGATSLLAPHLLKTLIQEGFQGTCHSRSKPASPPENGEFVWEALDAENPGSWKAKEESVVISAIPIWHTVKLLEKLAPCTQLIVFSSTSSITKTNSNDPEERLLSERLAAAEEQVKKFCRENSVRWTILRPTLIYDPGKDSNVSAIARTIKRWKIFPLAHPAKGLRQPVHVSDLAAAAVNAIANDKAFDTCFNLTGGETITYKTMVKRIYQGMGRTPLILPMPTIPLKIALKGANLFLNSGYSPELFTRMNLDLTFDSSSAREKLGYDPKPFYPQFEDL